MGLRERLAGRRVLVTGVTGFVGEALLERLLADLPETRVLVLIRPRGGQSSRDRLAALLGKPAFARLREQVSVHELAAMVDVVEGDLSAVPPLPGDLDVVIHCAGEVSFDPPIDEGFATNLGGLREVLRATRDSGARPHFVHVSTAYVAGLRSGHVPEAAVPHPADWQVEEQAAVRARELAEDASRTPERLAEFNAKAAKALGRAGLPAVAAEAEKRRQRWVRQRLVDVGRERAHSLGWTDCYTMTKALGESFLEQNRGDLPVSVVRPSIIESALARPFPGWIEGFKMAEPIILAYGRGELPDFPAAPDGLIDIIPVDLVVNAILAAAASPPEPDEPPRFYQVCSGTRNPLLFRELYEIVRGYFLDKPLIKRDRGAIHPPTWSFVGGAVLEGQLGRGEKAVRAADRVLSVLPHTPRVRNLVRDLDRIDAKLRFLRRYGDLYKPYTQAELIYDDANTERLHASLDENDRVEFGIDPHIYDWRDYLRQHCDSITAGLRALSAAPRRPARELPAVSSVGAGGGSGVLAVFDLDGTLVSSTVVESFLWLRLAALPRHQVPRELARVARAVPGWLRAERRDRGRLIREVYTRYAGADPGELARLVDTEVGEQLLARVSAAGLRRVRAHRAAGHRTVLLTGAIDLLVRPLAPLFDEVVAASLAVDGDGRCTGRLAAPPLVGEARAAWLRFAAPRLDADLRLSWAYADSLSDLPMLQTVGHPVAVNPDITLSRHASWHRWPIEQWNVTAGTTSRASAALGVGR